MMATLTQDESDFLLDIIEEGKSEDDEDLNEELDELAAQVRKKGITQEIRDFVRAYAHSVDDEERELLKPILDKIR